LLEHMVILDASVKIIGPVSLYLPIILQTAQYQEYKAGAKRNGALVNTLWVWPELGVEVNDNHTVGLSYRSANLASENLAQLTLGSGLEKGVAQLYWTGTF